MICPEELIKCATEQGFFPTEPDETFESLFLNQKLIEICKVLAFLLDILQEDYERQIVQRR